MHRYTHLALDLLGHLVWVALVFGPFAAWNHASWTFEMMVGMYLLIIAHAVVSAPHDPDNE